MSHAFLSASGSHRWIECTPSARLEEDFPQSESVYAAEGTFAHEMAEKHLSIYFGDITLAEHTAWLERAKKNEYYSNALCEYVDEYVNMCIEKYNALLADGGEPYIYVEHRVDFSDWVPNGFGTSDAVIIGNGILEVCDLKYGRNVAVSATNNSQLRLYALGAYSEFGWLYDIKTIRMTICQPRSGGINSEEIPVEELLAWGEWLKPIAQKAMKGKGQLHAGEHCKFCRAACRCKELATYNMDVAKYEFRQANLLSDDELAEILTKADTLVSYVNSIKDYALSEALKGKCLDGWKLVEGTARRKYSDEKAVAKKLIAEGFSEGAIYKEPSLIGLTDMKSLLGKKKFEEYLDGLIIKPKGKPVLVPESDKRPNYSDVNFESLE